MRPFCLSTTENKTTTKMAAEIESASWISPGWINICSGRNKQCRESWLRVNTTFNGKVMLEGLTAYRFERSGRKLVGVGASGFSRRPRRVLSSPIPQVMARHRTGQWIFQSTSCGYLIITLRIGRSARNWKSFRTDAVEEKDRESRRPRKHCMLCYDNITQCPIYSLWPLHSGESFSQGFFFFPLIGGRLASERH